MWFKSLVLAYREANGSGPSYNKEIIKSYILPAFPLYSKTANRLAPRLAHVRTQAVAQQNLDCLLSLLHNDRTSSSLTSGQMIPTHLQPLAKNSYFQTTSWWVKKIPGYLLFNVKIKWDMWVIIWTAQFQTYCSLLMDLADALTRRALQQSRRDKWEHGWDVWQRVGATGYQFWCSRAWVKVIWRGWM